MTTIASAIALALSFATPGAGHSHLSPQSDVSAAQNSISTSETLNWTQCTAITGDDHITIPSATTESECIALALKCVTHDDVQWTYHPYYVTTDSTFKRCDLSIS